MSNRRLFIKSLGATAILVNIPFWSACQKSHVFKGVLNEKNQQTLHDVLKILFPPMDHTPGIDQIKTESHINRYLTDQNIDPDEQDFLINGIKWLNETTQEAYQKDFIDLNEKQRHKIFKELLSEVWGESWLSKLLTLTFESLLLDPIYQVNTQKIGWQWLHHQPGLPRPSKSNAYTGILKRKKENIIITNIDQL